MVSSYQFYNVNKQKHPWVVTLGTSYLNFTRPIKLLKKHRKQILLEFLGEKIYQFA
jgi:hypothetical protein